MTSKPPHGRGEPRDLPAVLTIDETAELLRISRTTAYEMARRFELTGGREGLPSVRFGRSLRVPSALLLSMYRLVVEARPTCRRPRRSRRGFSK